MRKSPILSQQRLAQLREQCTRLGQLRVTHGARRGYQRTRTYRSWEAMKRRCLNPKASRYDRYGGRGITVCEEWMAFEGFFQDMGECPPGLTLDRIDNDGSYVPGNCRWATYLQQRLNQGGR